MTEKEVELIVIPRIKRLEEIETMEKEGIFDMLPKKEVVKLRKEYEKLKNKKEQKKRKHAKILARKKSNPKK